MKAKLSIVLFTFHFSLITCFAASIPLFVPESNARTTEVEPLERGAVVFYDSGDGRAEMVVGGDEGKAMRVSDPGTLHGFRMEEVPRKEFVVEYSDGVTYIPETDAWRMPVSQEITNALLIVCRDGLKISKVEWSYTYVNPDGRVGDDIRITRRIDGNRCTLICTAVNVTTLTVKDLKIIYCADGDENYVNDLTKTDFKMLDTVGRLPLSKWRQWARDYHLGNLGQDWSRYTAILPVKMLGMPITFGTTNRVDAYGLYSDGEMLVTTAHGRNAMTLSYKGGDELTNATMSAIAFSARDEIEISVAYSGIDDFDPAHLWVRYADALARRGKGPKDSDAFWHECPYTVISQSVGTVTLQCPRRGRSGFYKVCYDTSHAVLDVRGEIRQNGQSIVAITGAGTMTIVTNTPLASLTNSAAPDSLVGTLSGAKVRLVVRGDTLYIYDGETEVFSITK